MLDQAMTNLNISNPTSSQSWDLLREMVRLMAGNSSGFSVASVPKQPEPLPPLPKVHIETLGFPNQLASPKTHLRPLWDLWQNSLRQYFSPLVKDKKPPPTWEGGRQSTDNWNGRRDMLLELERQVAHCHSNITKVKDKTVAVNHVLDAWHVKMEGFEYICNGQKGRPKNKLTPADLRRCFFQIRSQNKTEVTLKKAACNEVCSAHA